jgi:hypothetical protein
MEQYMLIIAMPKSASTSFSETLGKIINKKVRLILPSDKKDKIISGYEEITKCHCNMKERPEKLLDKLANDNIIHREHLIPSDHHIDVLRRVEKPMILLLRDPDDVFDCYNRMFEKNKNNTIDREKLKNEIRNYYTSWKKLNIDNILTIHYSELVLDYNRIIKEVVGHLKCTGKIIPLLKKKYTGIGEGKLYANCSTAKKR